MATLCVWDPSVPVLQDWLGLGVDGSVFNILARQEIHQLAPHNHPGRQFGSPFPMKKKSQKNQQRGCVE
jgi:hypothetical protein